MQNQQGRGVSDVTKGCPSSQLPRHRKTKPLRIPAIQKLGDWQLQIIWIFSPVCWKNEPTTGIKNKLSKHSTLKANVLWRNLISRLTASEVVDSRSPPRQGLKISRCIISHLIFTSFLFLGHLPRSSAALGEAPSLFSSRAADVWKTRKSGRETCRSGDGGVNGVNVRPSPPRRQSYSDE